MLEPVEEVTMATSSIAPHDPSPVHPVRALRRRRPLAASVLVVLLATVAATAIPSGLLMIAWPDGSVFRAPPDLLASTPFDSWTLPGLLLVTCLGILPATAAVLMWRGGSRWWAAPFERLTRHHVGWGAAGASAVAIVIWIVMQVLLIPGLAVLQVAYFVTGAAIGLLTLAPSVRRWSALG